jgi:Holliday junction resolvase
MKTDNRTTGGRFEQELSHMLKDAGFWVHVFQQNQSGQPADIIAVIGHYHTLIDCKVISDSKGFAFDRMEENQKLAMTMFHKKCAEPCYFALKLPDNTIWMISMERLMTQRNRGKLRLQEAEIRAQAWSLDKWIENAVKVWSEAT